jgi:hypothetical protein
VALPFALAGAVVTDLVLEHGTTMDAEGNLAAGPDTGDSLLDSALVFIRASGRPRDTKHWVKALAARRFNIRGRVLQELVEAGVLTSHASRVLGVFPLIRYALTSPQGRDLSLEDVRRALLADGDVEPRLASLIALVSASGLLDSLVDREQRSLARRRAKLMAERDPGGRAVKSAIAETEAAVSTAVTAAIVSSSVGGGHSH